MKSLSKNLILVLFMIGLLSAIAMPIYLMISTACIKDALPQWFILTNFILSSLMLIFIGIMFLASLFDKDDKKNNYYS